MIRPLITATLALAMSLTTTLGVGAPNIIKNDAFYETVAGTNVPDTATPLSEGHSCGFVRRQVRIENPTVMIGEPVLLTLRLTGEPPIGLPTAEFVSPLQVGNDLRVFIQPPQGPAYEYAPSSSGEISRNTLMELGRGEFVERIFVLSFDPDSLTGSIFDIAGDYKLRVALNCTKLDESRLGGMDVPVGDFTVTVINPIADTDDNFALNAMLQAGIDAFTATHTLRPLTRGHVETLALLISKGGKAKLRPFAVMAMGNYHYLAAIGPDAETQRLYDAAPMFERFLIEYPDHPLAGMAFVRLLTSMRILDQDVEAKQRFDEAWSDPNKTHYINNRSVLYKWRFGEEDTTIPETALLGWDLLEDPRDISIPDSAAVDFANQMSGGLQAQIDDLIRQGQVEYRREPAPQ